MADSSPFDTTKPPLGFGTGADYSKPLRVYLQGDWYWLFDSDGYICRVPPNDPDTLYQLLAAEATSPVNPERKFYRKTARGLVFPGFDEEREKRALALEAGVASAAAEMKRKRLAMQTQANSKVSGLSSLTGAELLARLGLKS